MALNGTRVGFSNSALKRGTPSGREAHVHQEQRVRIESPSNLQLLLGVPTDDHVGRSYTAVAVQINRFSLAIASFRT